MISFHYHSLEIFAPIFQGSCHQYLDLEGYESELFDFSNKNPQICEQPKRNNKNFTLLCLVSHKIQPYWFSHWIKQVLRIGRSTNFIFWIFNIGEISYLYNGSCQALNQLFLILITLPRFSYFPLLQASNFSNSPALPTT